MIEAELVSRSQNSKTKQGPDDRLSPERRLTVRKKIGFTLIILCIAFLPLLILESVLFFAGWQGNANGSHETKDPFIGISGQESLFAKSEEGLYQEIRASRHGYFRPARFLAEKPDNGFRVFVVGGSTVQGRPWETETSFAKWLELLLQSSLPDQKVEVVNCGGVSYASYRLSHIVQEVVDYRPDLIVLCLGQNEFLEQRTYARIFQTPELAFQVHRQLSRSRAYRWLRHQFVDSSPDSNQNELQDNELTTRLDYQNGLDLFTKQNLQREAVKRHFRFHLDLMINEILERDIQLVVAAPPVNQKDCFPFKPFADWQVGSQSDYSTMDHAHLLELAPEPNQADYFFYRGLAELQSGDSIAAKKYLDRAIDSDICPLRMTSDLRGQLKEAASSWQSLYGNQKLLFIDLQARCEAVSESQLVGSNLLVDHVHPSISTHQKIARWIADLLIEKKIVVPAKAWLRDYELQATRHMDSLDFAYFQRGKERLESVLKWSRGQAVNALEPSQ